MATWVQGRLTLMYLKLYPLPLYSTWPLGRQQKEKIMILTPNYSFGPHKELEPLNVTLNEEKIYLEGNITDNRCILMLTIRG